ncbi:MAG: T9SS type A sorting domain-containing protein, partial [Candidatus Symbiothrix sp.]|nr:T9SS type A sorting domain-containing protein [Candidatus Symbiothrix sp.]
IYGQFSRSIEREAVSIGKTVMAFNGTSAYYERPLHTLDGIFTNPNNRWKFSRPILSDSLTYMIVDLESQYKVSRFKLYDSRYLEAEYPNLLGYNIYLSETAPNLSLIGKNKDNNTCWTKVVSAYDENRSDQSVKTDEITPLQARYVKLEIPRSRTTGESRIFQFEVFGEKADLAIAPVKSLSETVYPNPVKQGENIHLSGRGFLEVYSLQGNRIESRWLSSEINSISTAHLPPGVYLLHFNAIIVKLIII